MNDSAPAAIAAWASPPGCRPIYNYSNCGPAYQYALSIYYWVLFVLWVLIFLHVLSNIIMNFFPMRKKAKGENSNRGLRIYSCLCLAGCTMQVIFTYFMTNHNAYGVPAPVLAILYVGGCNVFLLTTTLVVLTWADALQTDSLKISSSFLDQYRWLYLAVGVERFLVNVGLAAFAGANIGGSSYLPLYRAYAVDWTIALLASGYFFWRFGQKMKQRLEIAELGAVRTRVFRVQILFTAGLIIAGIYTGLEAGIQHLLDENAVGWFLMFPGYHLVCMTTCSWFIIATPGKRDFVRKTATSRANSHSQSQAKSAT